MRRRVGLFLLAGVVFPLTFTASVSAQGSTLQLSAQTATSGQVLTVTGGSFSTAPNASAVEIRLDRRDGEPMASTSPDTRGQISATFPIPPGASPGWHLVIATQTTEGGRHRAFTPARARLLIVAAGGGAGVPAGGPTGGGPPIAPPIAVILTLLLLASGSTLAVRWLRTLNRPVGN